MKMKTLLAALAVTALFASAPAWAQARKTIANFPTAACTAGNIENRVFIATDALSLADCGTGGGTGSALCICEGGSFISLSGTTVADMAGSYVLITKAGQQAITASGAGNDFTGTVADDWILAITDDYSASAQDYNYTATGTSTLTAPVFAVAASTSALVTTPKLSVSGQYEFAVTNVTVADDAAGTKPAGVTPITTPYATCTCNDATGCTMSIAEPTVTAGYGRSLTIVSIGTGNCEYADSAGVTEIGAALVLEPTSTAVYAYINAAWHLVSTADNVP